MNATTSATVWRASMHACPVCGEVAIRELVAREFPLGQRLYACTECGLVQMVAAAPVARDYWADEAVTLDVYANDGVRAEMKGRYARYLPLLTPRGGRPGMLIDAGCGIGNFLAEAREAGWRAVRVEVSENAAAIARARGFDVETSRLEDSRLLDGTFDAITLWDVFPHFAAPIVALRTAHGKLKRGGTLLMEVPNEGFWMRRAARAAFAISGGRLDVLRYFYYPDHKFYFTRSTLEGVLAAAGFHVVQMWQDVTSPMKARLKIAPGRFPFRRCVLPVLPAVLRLMGRLGIGNKLIVVARAL